jgi:hypothetical protein
MQVTITMKVTRTTKSNKNNEFAAELRDIRKVAVLMAVRPFAFMMQCHEG